MKKSLWIILLVMAVMVMVTACDQKKADKPAQPAAKAPKVQANAMEALQKKAEAKKLAVTCSAGT